jgi:hypothetical protein
MRLKNAYYLNVLFQVMVQAGEAALLQSLLNDLSSLLKKIAFVWVFKINPHSRQNNEEKVQGVMFHFDAWMTCAGISGAQGS